MPINLFNPVVGETNNFFSGTDVTASRSIGTSFTNGPRKRLIFVAVNLDGSGGGVGAQYTAGRTAFNRNNDVTLTIGGKGSGSGHFYLTFVADPNTTYQINSNGTGTSTLIRWTEIDL